MSEDVGQDDMEAEEGDMSDEEGEGKRAITYEVSNIRLFITVPRG